MNALPWTQLYLPLEELEYHDPTDARYYGALDTELEWLDEYHHQAGKRFMRCRALSLMFRKLRRKSHVEPELRPLRG
jgi:hypothetical protein